MGYHYRGSRMELKEEEMGGQDRLDYEQQKQGSVNF
jgi:hypothetical protein